MAKGRQIADSRLRRQTASVGRGAPRTEREREDCRPQTTDGRLKGDESPHGVRLPHWGTRRKDLRLRPETGVTSTESRSQKPEFRSQEKTEYRGEGTPAPGEGYTDGICPSPFDRGEMKQQY